jgi:hypothetical protein
MTSACTRPDAPPEISAQLVACRHLVRGCEKALADLAYSWLEAGAAEEEAVHARAAEILDDILNDWRAALTALRDREPAASA